MKKRLITIGLFSLMVFSTIADQLIPYRKGNFWGYCDKSGAIVVPCTYISAAPLTEGVGIIQFNNGGRLQTQYLCQGGNSIKMGSYLEARPFYEDMSAFKVNNQSLFDINAIKNMPVVLGRRAIREVRFTFNNRWGFYDLENDTMIKPEYVDVGDFSEGLARVKKTDQWGFIDKTGTVIIPSVYQGAGDFKEGLAAVKKNGKWGFIDRKNNVVINCQYNNAGNFSEGLAPVKFENDRWGFISRNGETVIKPVYKSACSFSEGLASVKGRQGNGCIDKNGKIVIPFHYEMIRPFREGLAPAAVRGKWGFIDKTGKMIIPFKYVHALSFSNGVARVFTKWVQEKDADYRTADGGGYIDGNGKEYWEDELPWYEKMTQAIWPITKMSILPLLILGVAYRLIRWLALRRKRVKNASSASGC